MGTKRTADFRQEAVRVTLTSGLTRKQVASDFEIGFSTLSKWIQQERRAPKKPTAQSDLVVGMSTLNKWIKTYRDTDVVSKEDRELLRENERLRRENRILREEREVLKKAAIFFAGEKS